MGEATFRHGCVQPSRGPAAWWRNAGRLADCTARDLTDVERRRGRLG
ncbi:hypothetical protein I547_7078 [Mycobacterium kansasii 824]|nr:hypothetical protein I547_7078 [Mycobacterium kansasii 824]